MGELTRFPLSASVPVGVMRKGVSSAREQGKFPTRTRRSVPKITRPVLRSVTARARLFRCLDRLIHKHPVVWVSAPAGSGKTILAATWLVARKRPCLWYQMDAGDADPATFFYYLREAVGRLVPRRSEALPLLTPEYSLGVQVFARNFFERVGLLVPERIVLVLDNFQDLPEGAVLQSLLASAVSALGEGSTVLVLSRHAAPPAFARLVANGNMAFLDPDELNLTLNETRALARARVSRSLTLKSASELRDRTGGWMAAAVLYLEAPTRTLPAPRGRETATQQVLFDYFATEIFNRADVRAQKLLLATALLPEVTVAAAKALTGEPRATHLLSELVARNYFTVRLAGEEPRYRFHPLLREFLLGRAKASFSRERLAELKRIAAAELEKVGRWEDAASLLAEVSDWQRLADIVVGHAAEMLRAGRNRTVEVWLRMCPPEMLRCSPWLLYWLGATVLPSDPADSRAHFEAAFRLFKAQGIDTGSFLSWSGVIDTYVYAWGEFASLDGWIAEGEALLEQLPQFPSSEIEARFACGMFCALMYRQPHHPALSVWAERARTIAMGDADPALRAAIASHLVWYYSWWLGDEPKGASLLAGLRASIDSAKASPFVELASYAAESAYQFTGGHAECQTQVEAGLHLADRTGIHLFDFSLSLSGCWGALSAGDLDCADRHLRRMAPIVNTTRTTDIAIYHFTVGWMCMYKCKFDLALQEMQTALALSRNGGMPLGVSTLLLVVAEALIELERYDEATARLAEGYEVALRIRAKTCQYVFWLFNALCHFRQGESNRGLASLQEHLTIVKRNRILNHVCWRSTIMAELYAKALEAGLETELVHSLIRTRKIPPPPSCLDLPSWPWPLTVRVLGRFELCRDGEPVRFGRKPPRRPIELLQILVALGGSDGLRENTIVDCLWPDAEGDAGRTAIETTLHRLRRLLDAPGSIVQSDRTISLDPQSIWTDVQALNRLLANALADLGKEIESARVQEHANQVLALYQGPLLPGLEAEWALHARTRLRAQVGRFLRSAAQQLQRAGRETAAHDLLHRGLDADPNLRQTSGADAISRAAAQPW
jgi:LuxR family maltose regulon positive regulatory protein